MMTTPETRFADGSTGQGAPRSSGSGNHTNSDNHSLRGLCRGLPSYAGSLIDELGLEVDDHEARLRRLERANGFGRSGAAEHVLNDDHGGAELTTSYPEPIQTTGALEVGWPGH
jgi:hypothetical protein